jgi:3-phenylpropionate/trans-cinnamate dioxygenase ferredoxin subunit
MTDAVPANFLLAAKTTDLGDDNRFVAEVDETIVVIVRQDDEYYCIEDVCTHDGGVLSDGEFVDGCLICVRHGAKFDVKTGEAMCMPASEATRSYPVKIVGDDIYINVSA